jgi:hypothetical protein
MALLLQLPAEAEAVAEAATSQKDNTVHQKHILLPHMLEVQEKLNQEVPMVVVVAEAVVAYMAAKAANAETETTADFLVLGV